MKITESIFYVLSGTGNTYRIAEWLHDLSIKRGIASKLLMIDEVTEENRPENRKERLVTVMYPAHGLMAPWSMLKFLFFMPMGRGAPALSIATRGAIPIGPVTIPGAVGLGSFIAALIFLLKGYRVKGWFSLDMPVNMINLHWGMKPENTERIKRKAKIKIERLYSRTLDGRPMIYLRNTIWDGLWGGVLLWLVPIFPILYLLIGKLFMAKVMFSDNRCIGCGLCAKFCPNDAIAMKKIGDKKKPFWTIHCEACLRCMGYCKKKAVVASLSWGVALFYITLIPVVTYFLRKLELFERFYSAIPGYWLKYSLQMIDIIPALIISYWVFWLITRIPFVNTLFSYTTISRYFRKYHEPETKLKDLKKKKR